MSATLSIGLVQSGGSSQPEKNLEKARYFTRRAAGMGCEIVVFPEMFMAIPAGKSSLAGIAESLDGPFVRSLAGLARQYGIHLVCGVWEKTGLVGEAGEAGEHDEATTGSVTERVGNTLVVLNPLGELVCRYRKLHLFDALNVRESDSMVPGNELPPLFSVGGMNLSLAICYDLRFPELFRDITARGADAVLLPAAWYSGPLKEEHWLTLLRARAVENTIYTAGANLIGKRFIGRSTAFDPYGVCLGDAGEEENLLQVTLSAERIAQIREKLPVLSHRRNDLFR